MLRSQRLGEATKKLGNFNASAQKPSQPAQKAMVAKSAKTKEHKPEEVLDEQLNYYCNAFSPKDNEYILAYYMVKAIKNAYHEGKLKNTTPDEMFEILAYKAIAESGFANPRLLSNTIHKGPYHWAPNRFLVAMKKYGPAEYADHITLQETKNGAVIPIVRSEEKKAEILDLRYNTFIASYLEVRYTDKIAGKLKNALGPPISHIGVYMEHMMGWNNAVKLITAIRENPDKRIDQIFKNPKALGNDFFFKNKAKTQWLTASESYERFGAFLERKAQELESKTKTRRAAKAATQQPAFEAS